MLTPKQLDDYPARLVELYAQVEQDIIADMAARIAAKDLFISSTQWQMDKLLEMGNVQSEIEKQLADATGKSADEIRRIIEEAGYKSLQSDAKIYKKAGLNPLQALQSEAVKQALETGLALTQGEFTNITQTTVNNATMQYFDALDTAYLQVSSGAFDYNIAIRHAIQKLTDNGIAVATYASGHKDYMEVAVRRAALTGLNQASLKAQEALADEMDSDLVEVTAHAGARTGKGVANHAGWQGKVYSRSGNSKKYPPLIESTGYGTGPGLGGWNCRHNMFPFFEGVSEPTYNQKELDELNAPKYTYNGQELTEYEATQTQRHIERQIRKYKREVAGFDAAGIDTATSKTYLRRWQERQRDFIDQTGLKRDYDREQIGNGSKAVDSVSKMDYNYKRDKAQFERYKALLGENAPKSFYDFQSIKYGKDWATFKAYTRLIRSGELTPLANFDLYKTTSKEIDTVLVGKTINNGIIISGKSDHFIARTIGSVEQKRNGVNVQTSLKVLLEPIKVDPAKQNANGPSQRLIGEGAAVTINPETGRLIQVNPLKNKEKEGS